MLPVAPARVALPDRRIDPLLWQDVLVSGVINGVERNSSSGTAVAFGRCAMTLTCGGVKRQDRVAEADSVNYMHIRRWVPRVARRPPSIGILLPGSLMTPQRESACYATAAADRGADGTLAMAVSAGRRSARERA